MWNIHSGVPPDPRPTTPTPPRPSPAARMASSSSGPTSPRSSRWISARSRSVPGSSRARSPPTAPDRPGSPPWRERTPNRATPIANPPAWAGLAHPSQPLHVPHGTSKIPVLCLKSGVIRPDLTCGTPLGRRRDMPTDTPIQMQSIADLMSEIESLQSRLHELEREVEQSQRLATLGTLVGAVAHEFNNLLTPVMSYAQLALARPDDPNLTHRALTKAVEGTQKASKAASSILGFLQDSDGELVNVRTAIEDALTCLAREPQKDGIQLEIDVPGTLWARIRPVALEQVLLNLLINARRAILPGRGSIRIHAECSTWNTPEVIPEVIPEDGAPAAGGCCEKCIRIRFSDTGCGMDGALVEKVFQPFVRGPRREGSGPSTGLGLAISRRLIEEAHGEILVESEPGKGTTFTIVLPAGEPDES
ncbi:MAG: hypothetical protein EA380_00705 [Phycisphaeraceae bacterium]|nr:MAG: hypothetical protein EA380_00705 [Phycisphaeraceae bacterium]